MARNRSPSPTEHIPLGHSATSPQPMVSKRDKRRTMLADKLGEMMASFSDNRDFHYKAQLAALQADLKLILKADPYSNKPLEDGGAEANELIAQVMGSNMPAAPSAATDYIAQVGKHYMRFVEAVNDALEERDFNLTMLWNKHESTKNEIENAHLYKIEVAEQEHKLLAQTIRERLTASLTARTTRLKREKEQLDLADSNAMLLHPNQFSIAHPASPGGPQAPRKTRRTGHKFGDTEDMAAGTENKRKRKLFEDNDNDSPGPSGRNADLGAGSPFREAKAKTMHAQFEAAAYSLERLFTEKELGMAMNNAANAAMHFFEKENNPNSNHEAATNGTNGVNGDHASDNGDGADDHDPDSPNGAVEMTRQISSNPHATRGATRSAMGPAGLSGRWPFVVNRPYIIPANVSNKANAPAPPPTPLNAQEVDTDFRLMFRDAPPDDPINEQLLETACKPVKAREFQLQPPGHHQPIPDILSSVRDMAPHLGIGETGSLPMSRNGSYNTDYSLPGSPQPRRIAI